MNKTFVCIALTAGLAAAVPTPAQAAKPATKAAIEHLGSEFVAAWNAHDAKKMAAVWTADGDLINPFGQKASGRAAIEKFFEAEQAGVMKGTTYKIESTSIRELDKNTAFADWESVVTGMTGPDGKPAPPFRHHVSIVYVMKGGHWGAAAVRAYSFPTPPAPPAK